MRLRFAQPAIAALAAVLLASACGREARLERIDGYAQGTTYSLQWWGTPDAAAGAIAAAVDDELARLDALLSGFRPDSAVEAFNAVADTAPHTVPDELVALVELARAVHAASDGCFDATVRPLVHAWGFDSEAPHRPSDAVLEAVRPRIGMRLVEVVDAHRLRKVVPGVELDLSSIGQGYTAGRLAAVLETFGAANYLVEIGGEIVARGRRADGAPWRIGVESPAALNAVLRTVTVAPDGDAAAVITSGTYRKFFTDGGRRYSHILDPRTLAPVEHALAAVTVVGPDAAAAAAWATALVCLGPDEALGIAERERLEALLLVERDGAIEQRATAAFPRG